MRSSERRHLYAPVCVTFVGCSAPQNQGCTSSTLYSSLRPTRLTTFVLSSQILMCARFRSCRGVLFAPLWHYSPYVKTFPPFHLLYRASQIPDITGCGFCGMHESRVCLHLAALYLWTEPTSAPVSRPYCMHAVSSANLKTQCCDTRWQLIWWKTQCSAMGCLPLASSQTSKFSNFASPFSSLGGERLSPTASISTCCAFVLTKESLSLSGGAYVTRP